MKKHRIHLANITESWCQTRGDKIISQYYLKKNIIYWYCWKDKIYKHPNRRNVLINNLTDIVFHYGISYYSEYGYVGDNVSDIPK